MFKRDYNYGVEKEQEVKPLLEKYFNTTLCKTENNMCCYDFENEDKNLLIELKSRRVKYNQYPTTLLCKSKLDFAKQLNDDIDLYFVFHFTDDGLYYIKYTKDLLDYPIKRIRIYRGDFVSNIEINTKDLVKIN